MTLAMPLWEGRISPVLDVAGLLVVVHLENGTEGSRKEKQVHGHSLPQWTSLMAELGVEVVICGAVSSTLEAALAGAGVQVIPWIKGEADQVLSAYLCGQLSKPRFRMPGTRHELGPAPGSSDPEPTRGVEPGTAPRTAGGTRPLPHSDPSRSPVKGAQHGTVT